jgi:hypothetical protein
MKQYEERNIARAHHPGTAVPGWRMAKRQTSVSRWGGF